MSVQATAFAAMSNLAPAIAAGRSETAAATDKAAAAMRVGRQFEQMFLSQMLAPMFAGLDADGPFGGGNGEQMMRSFQIDAFAQSIVSRGGIGLAQQVAREVLRLQEKQDA